MGGPGQQGNTGGGFPLLQPPDGQIPGVLLEAGPDNTSFVGFSVQTASGAAPMILALPNQGWDASPAGVFMWRGGTTDTNSEAHTAGMAQFQYTQTQDGRSVRFAVPQWQYDQVGVGQICIGFESQSQGDVSLRGSTVCVLDSQCGQAAGCGRIP